MDLKILFVAVFAVFAVVQSAPPVFLDHGSKLCTLHNIGKIPKGHLQYPVYQKVCRKVIGQALGDEVDDEDDRETRKSNIKSRDDEEADQIRREILRSE